MQPLAQLASDHANYIHVLFIIASILIVFGCVQFSHARIASAATVTKLSAAAQGTVTGITAGSNLNVRSTPSTSATILGKMQNGAAMKITGYTSDGWLEMNTTSIKLGYVSAQYVNVPVVSVAMTATTKTVAVGSATATAYTISPTCATNKAVTWTSSNTAVATVGATGSVTAKAAGTATITVKTASSGKTATCVYTVQAAAAASTLAISGSMTIPNPLTVGKAVVVQGTITSNYNITSVTIQIKTSTGTVKYTSSATPNAKSYNTNSMDATMKFSSLAAGSYVYTVTAKDASGTSKTLRSTAFTVQAAAAASTLAITGSMTIPNPLTVGKAVVVQGTVASNYNITNVTAQIKTSAGTVKYTASATPNAKTYNTNGMDAAMKFSSLAAGSYVYVVTAKDASGTSKTLRSTAFTVQAAAAASTLALTGSMTIPNPLAKGKAVVVQGTVASNYNITSVTTQIKTSTGTVKYTSSATPNAKSYNTHNMDAAMKFSSLAAGSYVYVVTAKDASGTSKTLRNTAFTVR